MAEAKSEGESIFWPVKTNFATARLMMAENCIKNYYYFLISGYHLFEFTHPITNVFTRSLKNSIYVIFSFLRQRAP